MKNRIKWMAMAAMLAAACVFSACQKSVDVENTTTPSDVEMVSTQDIGVETIAQEVKLAYGASFVPTEHLSAAQIEQMFSIGSGMYEEAYVLIAKGNTPDLCAIFSGSKDMVDQIEVALNKYRNSMVNKASEGKQYDWMVQGSKVIRYDSYVALFILGDKEEIIDLNTAREQNDIGCNTMKRVLKK